MVTWPKKKKMHCPDERCKAHKEFKIVQYKAGKARLFAQGKRRYDSKQAGYGGQTKPIFHKKTKTTKKVTVKLQCTVCKKTIQNVLKRCKSFQLNDKKKTGSKDPTW
jgi:large subunit ribosomal protein L44e